jgi:hypothetical protein
MWLESHSPPRKFPPCQNANPQYFQQPPPSVTVPYLSCVVGGLKLLLLKLQVVQAALQSCVQSEMLLPLQSKLCHLLHTSIFKTLHDPKTARNCVN